ncbi:MAG: hypothetical protein RIT81_26475 [Deltaproteobacteria bacterium]
MPEWFAAFVTRTFDGLHARYQGDRARKTTSLVLLIALAGSLLTIEANRRGLVPAGLSERLPDNHFVAVEWVVAILLLFEIIELVFGLARSVAGALGTQLEVFALILLRKSFEELKHFAEPIDLGHIDPMMLFAPTGHPLPNMMADATGALTVFGGLVVYRRLQRHYNITASEEDLASFIVGKKALALFLLAGIASFIGAEIYDAFATGDPISVFPAIFTALIFSDIAIVLLSLRYTSRFRVVFRNFGFTVVTVFVRLAITAPPVARAIMAVGVIAYAVGLAWLYNEAYRRSPSPSDSASAS